jgi:hypothetical protein
MVPIPGGDIDLEFHSDIRLTSTIENKLIEYVALYPRDTGMDSTMVGTIGDPTGTFDAVK